MPQPPPAYNASELPAAIVETAAQVMFAEDLLLRELHCTRERLLELMAVVGASPWQTATGERLWHWLAVEAAVLASTWPQLKWTPRRMRAAIAWVYGLNRDMKTRRVHEQLKTIGSVRKRSRKRGQPRKRRGDAAALAATGRANPVAFASDPADGRPLPTEDGRGASRGG